MLKEDEEMFEELRKIKKKAEKDIKKNHPGYENCKITNVVHYNKPVELVNRKSGKKEEFDLCVAWAEDPETNEIWEMYYLDGEEVDFTQLMRKYESAKPIKDVIEATKDNEERPDEEKDDELVKEDLNELKEREEAEEIEDSFSQERKQNPNNNSLTGKKLKYAIQTIDIDKAYIDNRTSVRSGFSLPPQVKQIAIAKPMQNTENVLSSTITIYMLDDEGKIIKDIDGKTIKDFFEIDRATGKNPINDENTKIELDGYAERNRSHTIRRFKSKQNQKLYLSAEQNKIGDYAQVYAGRKTVKGNNPVEVQLETRNVGIQTSLAMQRIVAGYKGIYNADEIDKEVDKYEGQGNNIENIPIENADGIENQEYEGRFRKGPWDK